MKVLEIEEKARGILLGGGELPRLELPRVLVGFMAVWDSGVENEQKTEVAFPGALKRPV